jgi:hypothetical protein
MNKTQKILLGACVVQILLVALVFWPKEKPVENRDLVFGERTAEEVTEINVADANGNEAILSKVDDSWVIPALDNYPVDSTKVDTLLEDLFAVRYGRFVAENVSSHERLEVGEKQFNRRINLVFASGESQSIFVGSTPATAATNFRMGGDDNVYLSDQLNSYSYGSTPVSWINTALVRFTADAVNGMQIANANGSLTFMKSEDNAWTIADLQEGEEANGTAISTLATRATSMSIVEPLGKTEDAAYGMDKPTADMVLSLTDADGNPQQLTLTFGAVDPETNLVVVKSSAWDYYVKVNATGISEILGASAVDFITVPEVEATPES